ncbi:MAG TPA: succinate dehydrogenase assembly factor 2 [Solimonas sp.]|nr:succinate dehydrogenase assembly factor 2 [Solimonas sp.]
MKELDVLTERYYARRWPGASPQQRASFVRMLQTVEDPDLYSWAMNYSQPPAEFEDVIQQLRRHD